MRAILMLLSLSVLLRLAGAVARTSTSRAVNFFGWLMGGLAAWAAASAAGAWTPFWYGPAITALGFVCFIPFRAAWPARLADAVAVAVIGAVTVPVIPLLPLLSTVAFALVSGLALDRGVVSLQFRTRTWVLFCSVCAVVGLAGPDSSRMILRFLSNNPRVIPFTGLTPIARTEKIVLPTGAVAWLDRPAGEPVGGALFFHGYHSMGAWQPASIPIRRALRAAGYVVLSMDHPGYGKSPVPKSTDPVAAWDVAPHDLAAYDALKKVAGERPIIVAGHSMGCLQALRMMTLGRPVAGIVVMGAGREKQDKLHDAAFRLREANRKYGFNPPLTLATWIQANSDYFDPGRVLKSLPAGKTKILFVMFSRENSDLAETRDAYFSELPEPKERAMVHASHYMDATGANSLLAGNAAPSNELSALIREKL